jgi:hypothetical protein
MKITVKSKNNKNRCKNVTHLQVFTGQISWFKSIVYLAEKLKIDLEKIKNFSRDKLKSNLKDCLKKNFISFWREERTSSLGLNEGPTSQGMSTKSKFSKNASLFEAKAI